MRPQAVRPTRCTSGAPEENHDEVSRDQQGSSSRRPRRCDGVRLAEPAAAQQARDQIRVVGSSTVYPFTTTVAERFSQTGGFKAPIVESTGTGGGMKLFCGGVGTQHPDLTNASRAMTKGEFEQCAANGVKEIVEMKVGFDGIAVALKKGSTPVNLKREDIWLAWPLRCR